MHIQSLHFPNTYPTSPNQHSHLNTIKSCSFKYPTLQSYIPSYIHTENTQVNNNQLSLSISQIHADRSPCYNTHYLNKTTVANNKQTKTSKFFSFFKAEKLSQNNTSVCQQMLNQLEKVYYRQEKQDSRKQCDSFQEYKQINVSMNSQQINIKRLNKTQIFMSAFKDRINRSNQAQIDFKKNKTILLQQDNIDKEIKQIDKKDRWLEDIYYQDKQKIQEKQEKSQNVLKLDQDIQDNNQSCKIIQTQNKDEVDNIKKQEYVDNYCSSQLNPKIVVTYAELSQQQKDVQQQSSHISDNLNSYSELSTLQYGHDTKNQENADKVEHIKQNNNIFFCQQLKTQQYSENFMPKKEQVQEQQKEQQSKQDKGQSQGSFKKQQEEQQQQQQQKQYDQDKDQEQLEQKWQSQQQQQQSQQQQKFVIENKKNNQFQHQQDSFCGQQCQQQQKQQHSQKQIIKQQKLVLISQQIPEKQYKSQKRQEKEQQFNNEIYIQYEKKQKVQSSEQDIDSVTDQIQEKEQQSQIQINYESQASEIRHINIHQAGQLVNQWESEEQSVQDIPPMVEQPVQNISNHVEQQLNNIQIKKALIIGLYLYKKTTAHLISEINQIISSYYSSNYFQVVPRRQILNYMREFFVEYQSLSIWTQDQCNTKYNNYVKSLQDLLQIKNNSYLKNYYKNLKNFGKELIQTYCRNKEKRQQLQDIISEYSGSNYFHVSKRRYIFSEIKDLIKLVEKTRKLILQDIARNNQENHQQSQHQSDKHDQQEQEQFDEQEQQDQEDQEDQEEQQEQQDESLQEEQQQNQQYSQSQRDTVISNLNSAQPIRFVNDVSFLQTQVSLNASTVSRNSQNIPQQQRQIHYQIPQPQYSLQKLKSYHIGKYIKQKMNNSKIASLQNTLASYSSSNYFHVGPRYQLLGFMSMFVDFVNNTNSKLNLSLPEIPVIYAEKIIKIGQQIRNYFDASKIQQIRSTCSSYYSSNYFHVGARYSLFGDVRKLIKFYQMIE